MAVSYMMCWILNLSHAFVPLPSCKACLVSRRSCIIWQSVCAVLGHDPVTFHSASPQMWSFSTGLAHPAGFWAWTWEEKPCLGLLKLRPSLSQGNKRILCALDRSCGHSFISHPGGIKGWSGILVWRSRVPGPALGKWTRSAWIRLPQPSISDWSLET